MKIHKKVIERKSKSHEQFITNVDFSKHPNRRISRSFISITHSREGSIKTPFWASLRSETDDH